MEKIIKNKYVLAIVALIIIIIIVLSLKGNKKEEVPVVVPVDQAPAVTTPVVTTEPVKTVAPTKKAAVTPELTYADALKKYADRRIQLDPSCQAVPNNVTYKDNTGIMLDNRSSQTRTIKAGTTFTIKPYGFKILTLPDIALKAKKIMVNCDGYVNVATILVQE